MARHVQPNLWQPSMWTQYAYQAQIGETARSDVQRALDRSQDLMSNPDPETGISEETEKRLQSVVDRAVQDL